MASKAIPCGKMVFMPTALPVLRTKTAAHGGVVEMVVWRVVQPVPPSEHLFKYRLVFVRRGARVVGYDNERGKGDHKHLGARELRYEFSSIEALIADFLNDVEKLA
jgi:Family of unknown function (DUF6516)